MCLGLWAVSTGCQIIIKCYRWPVFIILPTTYLFGLLYELCGVSGDLVWLHSDPVNMLSPGNTRGLRPASAHSQTWRGLCREQEQALPQLLRSPHPAPPGQWVHWTQGGFNLFLFCFCHCLLFQSRFKVTLLILRCHKPWRWEALHPEWSFLRGRKVCLLWPCVSCAIFPIQCYCLCVWRYPHWILDTALMLLTMFQHYFSLLSQKILRRPRKCLRGRCFPHGQEQALLHLSVFAASTAQAAVPGDEEQMTLPMYSVSEDLPGNFQSHWLHRALGFQALNVGKLYGTIICCTANYLLPHVFSVSTILRTSGLCEGNNHGTENQTPFFSFQYVFYFFLVVSSFPSNSFS